jgi:hypothetical protein
MNKRCTSADRDAVADELSLHYAAGSVNLEEFNIRLDKAMSAVWESDLNDLYLDLPELPDRQMPQPQSQAVRSPAPRVVTPIPRADHENPSYRTWTYNQWTLQNWLALFASITVVTIAAILFSGDPHGGGGAYWTMAAGCALIGALTGWRRNWNLAVVGLLSGFAPIAGILLMIGLTWRRKIKAS